MCLCGFHGKKLKTFGKVEGFCYCDSVFVWKFYKKKMAHCEELRVIFVKMGQEIQGSNYCSVPTC